MNPDRQGVLPCLSSVGGYPLSFGLAPLKHRTVV